MTGTDRDGRVFRSATSCCIATAQRIASITLANSTRMPSPVFFTILP